MSHIFFFKNNYIKYIIIYLIIYISELFIINHKFSIDDWFVVYINSFILFIISLNEIRYLFYSFNQKNKILLHPYFLTIIFTFLFSLGGLIIFLMIVDGRPLIFNGTLAENVLYSDVNWFIKSTGLSVIAIISMIFGYKFTLGNKLFNLYYFTFKFGNLLEKEISLIKFIALFIFAYFVKIYLYSNGLYGYQQLSNEEFINSRLLVFVNLGFLLFIISGIISNKLYHSNIKYFKILYTFILPAELIFAISHGARSPIIFFVIGFLLIYYFSNKQVNIKLAFLLSFTFLYAFTIGSEFKKFISDVETSNKNPITSIVSFIKNRNKIKNEISQLNQAAVDLSGNQNIALYFALSRFTYYSETALAIRYKDAIGLQKNDPPFLQYIYMAPIFAFFPPYYLFNVESPKWGGWFYVNVEGKNSETSSSAFSPLGFLYLSGKFFAVTIGFFFFGIIVKFTSRLLTSKSIGGIILFLSLLSITYNYDTNVSDFIVFFFRYTILVPFIYSVFFAKN